MKTKRIILMIFAVILLASATTGLAGRPASPAAPEAISDTGWNFSCVACNANSGRPSLALDSHNVPHISYVRFTDNNLIYTTLTESGWTTQTVDKNVFIDATPALVIDSNDRAQIAYFDANTRNLKYAIQDGSDWDVDVVDDDVDGSSKPGLALDGANNPHISYVNSTDNSLRHAYKNNGDWDTETITDRVVYNDASIAVDSSEYAHISYSYAAAFWLQGGYAFQDSSGWHFEDLESTQNSLRDFSLKLTPYGFPRLSYYITFNDGYQGRLRYAYKDASGWHRIDLTPCTEWSRCGAYSSLELDAIGNPHISFQDVNNGDLLYTYEDAQGWYTETVDTEGMTGFDTSLELGFLGMPCIAYAEETTGSVLYAWYIGPYNQVYLPLLSSNPDL